MTNLADLGVAAAINIATAFVFLAAFAVLRLQPINGRVYYPKWYINGSRQGSGEVKLTISRIVNLDLKGYLRFLEWVRESLKMPEQELIEHAGLDSVIYLRIYIIGLKIFIPMMLLGFGVLFPINLTGNNINIQSRNLTRLDMDKLSLTNVEKKSSRLWAYIVMSYMFSIWTCVVLFIQYKAVMLMRLHFLDMQQRRPDEFTVLVKNIPTDPDEPPSRHIEHFFRVNHPDYYLTHQIVRNANKLAKLVQKRDYLQNWLVYYQNKLSRQPGVRPTVKKGFLGLWGEETDAIDYYTREVARLKKEIAIERAIVLEDPNAVLPVAFVSFKGRWGAAVAAQTQQTKDPTIWLTEWAPEPRDVYWNNLSIPFVEIAVRRLIMAIALFFLVFFFMIPITFVQSLANMDKLSEKLPFLKPIVRTHFVSSLIQGYLPGLALKIFLILLPMILMFISKIEGYASLSQLERRSAAKYFLFLVVTVFFGSILTGSASQQLSQMLGEPPNKVPELIGAAVASKVMFFITYIMVDGWAGISGEILRLKPLIIFHLKNFFLVKTERDREKAMDPGSIGLDQALPQIELYFLLGIVYSVIAPILLPFIIIYWAFAYLVYRHQIINVYDQQYESAGAFWPHLHTRIITCLIIQQISLFGLMVVKEFKQGTPLLLLLPVFTIAFHLYCKNRFEPAFRKYPLEDAMRRDTRERAMEPSLNLKRYLQNTYLHPVLQMEEEDDECGEISWDAYDRKEGDLIPTKRTSRATTPAGSVTSESPILIL